MDDELMENMLADAHHVRVVLGMDMEQYARYRANTINGLTNLGGSFARSLGFTLEFADLHNSVKILNVWQKECIEHELLWRIHEAKKRSEE